MKGSGSSVATFAIGADGSTLAVVTNGDTVVAFLNMRDEIERLRARVAVLESALRDARENGKTYWRPMTVPDAAGKAAMIARIDAVLKTEATP
jgi:hypothetical protein